MPVGPLKLMTFAMGGIPRAGSRQILSFLLHLKRRWSQLESREELQGSWHNSKSPNPLLIYLIPLHWLDCHPEYRLTTRWHVWQPCGTWKESHRSVCQLDRKPNFTVTAGEEGELAHLHTRWGLTPLWKLHRNLEIHVSKGEEAWGCGLISRWRPRTWHWLERNPERPLATRMETGLSCGNTVVSLKSPS